MPPASEVSAAGAGGCAAGLQAATSTARTSATRDETRTRLLIEPPSGVESLDGSPGGRTVIRPAEQLGAVVENHVPTVEREVARRSRPEAVNRHNLPYLQRVSLPAPAIQLVRRGALDCPLGDFAVRFG